jgi:phosphoribosylpyrophosphate synthetase
MATHAVLSSKEKEEGKIAAEWPLQRMVNAGVKKFITTDTIYRDWDKEHLTVYSVAPVISEMIFKK